MSCSDITDVSNIFFCNDTCISGNVQNVLSISGDFGVTTKDGVGNLKVTDTDLVSVAAGTDAIPAINFSVAGSSSTGMYRPAADAVGFSTGGAEKVRISPPGIYYPVGGLSVGTAGNIAGIRRLSAISANSWEDGHLGNSKALIFTPSDMVIGSASARAIQTQSLQPDPARPGAAYYGTTTITGDGTICCQKVIPKGFQIGRYPGGGASTIRIYTPNGQLNSGTCYVSAQKVDTLAVTPLLNLLSSTTFATTDPAAPAAAALLGPDVAVGDGNTILTIYWQNTASAPIDTSTSISSIEVTMERV